MLDSVPEPSPDSPSDPLRDDYRAFRAHRQKNDPLVIRLHRALSWRARAAKCPMPDDADMALILRWMAFNSLYGRWNALDREPEPDLRGWQAFCDQLLKIDRDGQFARVLKAQQSQIHSLLEDPFVTQFFWIDPDADNSERQTNDRLRCRTWYVESKWSPLLDAVLRRVYLVRCQLVHGAATCGGRFNRPAVRLCAGLMEPILEAAIRVLIDHGGSIDWGIMCYPPLHDTDGPAA